MPNERQQTNPIEGQNVIDEFIKDYRKRIYSYLGVTESPKSPFPSFAELKQIQNKKWIGSNYDKFLQDSPNEIMVELSYMSEMGYITALAYSADGSFIVVGHSSGLIQVRNSTTGKEQCTLRSIQFPPRPVYALNCSRLEDRVCYASCTDGVVYRLEIPSEFEPEGDISLTPEQELETLNVQYFGTQKEEPNNLAKIFFTSRSAALSCSLFCDNSKMGIGFADSSIKIVDMETQEPITTFKMHKLRMDLLPKRLQRVHRGQVSALECHPERHNVFASGSWDATLRVWDIRCKIGCMMTFEGVNIIGNSIDLNRDILVAGSWQPLEALTTWDIRAHNKLSIIRAQNRRVDVDGEYFYACKFWRSSMYNRKSKYAIVAGSGTQCVEIINLHNRYISCSFPSMGTTLAVASFEDQLAWGGTDPVFSIACFHDPKHETEAYVGEETVDVERWAEEAGALANEAEENLEFGIQNTRDVDEK